jgi:hypothetical protein
LNDAFQRFKDLADKKKHVFDDDIVALLWKSAVPCAGTSAVHQPYDPNGRKRLWWSNKRGFPAVTCVFHKPTSETRLSGAGSEFLATYLQVA